MENVVITPSQARLAQLPDGALADLDALMTDDVTVVLMDGAAAVDLAVNDADHLIGWIRALNTVAARYGMDQQFITGDPVRPHTWNAVVALGMDDLHQHWVPMRFPGGDLQHLHIWVPSTVTQILTLAINDDEEGLAAWQATTSDITQLRTVQDLQRVAPHVRWTQFPAVQHVMGR